MFFYKIDSYRSQRKEREVDIIVKHGKGRKTKDEKTEFSRRDLLKPFKGTAIKTAAGSEEQA